MNTNFSILEKGISASKIQKKNVCNYNQRSNGKFKENPSHGVMMFFVPYFVSFLSSPAPQDGLVESADFEMRSELENPLLPLLITLTLDI